MMNVLMPILAILVILGGAILLVCLPEIVEWLDDIPERREERKERQYIDFKSFQHFYTVSEDRWFLEKNYVEFFKGSGSVICTTPSGKPINCIKFHFHFKDRRQYKKWKRTHEKQEQQIASIEALQEVLSIVQKDIHKFNKENEARIDKATNNIDGIVARMLKEVRE